MKDTIISWIRDKLLPPLLIGVILAALNLYYEVKILRRDMDRMEVYIDQLWKEKR